MKTVLLIIETLNRGGIETVLLRLIPNLEKEGWSSVVVTIKEPGEMMAEYEAAGITVRPLRQSTFFSLSTLKHMANEIETVQPDLIVTNLFKSDVLGRLFLRFITDRPVVPYLVTTYNHPRYWVARVFEWLTKPLARHYIANSEAVRHFYEKKLGVRPGKIVVAPNGVDVELFSAADERKVHRELGLPKDAFVVTCVANLAANKGQADLLAAFDAAFVSIPQAFLLLVGDGEQRADLTAQRAALPSRDRIFLLGRRTDVPAILKATTVFVLPTLFEGMSTALLEAMAAQKAIITTNIPENKVLLTHDRSALLVDPSSRQQLAAALEQMYQNPSLRQRLASAAFAEVGKKYSIATMAQTFTAIFGTLCGYAATPSEGRPTIIHIISSLGSGGAENMLLRTLPLLSKDFQHIVITLFGPGELAPEFRKKGITVRALNLRHPLDVWGWPRLVKELRQNNPILIVTYLFHAGLITRLYVRRKVVVPMISFLRSTYNFPRYLPARIFERLTKNLVDHYFANSEAVKNYYVAHIGVDPAAITVIPNGVDLTAFKATKGQAVIDELKLPRRGTVITCVANLAVNKGHIYLLDAFETMYKRHPQSYLLIVGEGRERANLEAHIQGFDSNRHIFFLGRRHDVPAILAMTDIFVLPTMFEGLSNAILEAMAAGCAVVTTDIPENRVMVTDGVTGLLVPTHNSHTIATTLDRLITDRSLKQKLGHHAQAFIADHFDLKAVARELDRGLKAHCHDAHLVRARA